MIASERADQKVALAVSRFESGWMPWRELPRSERLRLACCAGYLLLLSLAFIQPLTKLVLYAARSDLNSYILLVPFIAGYLLYTQRARILSACRSSIAGTVTTGGIGFAALVAGIVWSRSLSINDDLSLAALAFVSFAAAGGFLFLGARWMAARAFPVAFLIFMVPLPDAAVDWLENASMLATAEVAALFFNVVGTPTVREGTVFELPGIVLQVARECSGIHSSWVLFLTALLASHLFLRTRWRRILLVAFVIPLGILRNGFRVFTIGQLCVHIGPYMIDSKIHRQGGPLFFALSLVPLFLLLLWLRRRERGLNLPC
jgi:exosortase C (VPDSG-CTERM-specific)